jgi:hypothetical protein
MGILKLNAEDVDVNGLVSEAKRSAEHAGKSYRYIPPKESEVEACISFFNLCQPTKGGRVYSYWLKHVIENWAGSYVSNGACIEAARRLGLVLATGRRRQTLNCWIGVSRRSVLNLRTDSSPGSVAKSALGSNSGFER